MGFPARGEEGPSIDVQALEIEDAYSLSPMQQGMLYHTLERPEDDVYSVRVAYELRGDIDMDAFAAAWQRVVDRHPVLRSSIHWERGDYPLQRVHRRAVLPIERLDLRSLSSAELRARRSELLSGGGESAAFDLHTPPLMRLTLARLDERTYELVLTHHHLLMDGSCRPVVFAEVFRYYEAIRAERDVVLPPPHSYREFVDWLERQDLAEAERFWRKELKGFGQPTPPWSELRTASSSGPEYEERKFAVDPRTTEALRLFGRKKHLTLNTLVLGSWALVLSRLSRSADVVFGATVNGRPVTLEGADSIVGLFINTLPVRVRVSPEARLLPWLTELQVSQARSRDYHYAPLGQIQRWSEVPGGQRLFESNLVFENNVGYGCENERYGDVEIANVRASMRNSFPLTLRCVPGASLSLELLYETQKLDDRTVARIGDALAGLLARISRDPEGPAESSDTLARLVEGLLEPSESGRAADSSSYESAVAAKLKSAAGRRTRSRATPIRASSSSLCEIGPLFPDKRLPVLVAAKLAAVELSQWLEQNREEVTRHLRNSGAVLFRSFGVKTPEELEKNVRVLSKDLLSYTYRSTPRTRVAGRIYTSTEYPADRSIPLHNENAYSSRWPMKLWFCCAVPARRGGETPIADSRAVLARIPPAVRERFETRGVMYVRNYGLGVDLPWQEVFQTEDRSEVERHCREAGIELEWKDEERLTTRQVCPALAVHPVTGESVWFNQAHLFHVSSLPPSARELMLEEFGEDNLPRNALYGDGSSIDPGDLEEIRKAYERETVVYPWLAGDVLLVDNMLVAHGRKPFEGPRSVLVGMAESHGVSGTPNTVPLF